MAETFFDQRLARLRDLRGKMGNGEFFTDTSKRLGRMKLLPDGSGEELWAVEGIPPADRLFIASSIEMLIIIHDMQAYMEERGIWKDFRGRMSLWKEIAENAFETGE